MVNLNVDKPGDPQLPTIYPSRLTEMCLNGKQSYELTFSHLAEHQRLLAQFLVEAPMGKNQRKTNKHKQTQTNKQT